MKLALETEYQFTSNIGMIESSQQLESMDSFASAWVWC